jgi:hypothetical protein
MTAARPGNSEAARVHRAYGRACHMAVRWHWRSNRVGPIVWVAGYCLASPLAVTMRAE